MEWEREQFRRGGSRIADVNDKPAVKQEYKPAPSTPISSTQRPTYS